jgi:hypothetical protein
MAIQMIPGGLLLIGMIFQNRQLPANHPFVAAEIAEITQSVMIEKAVVGESSIFSLIKDIFTIPANRRRYLLAIILQIFQ